MVSLGQRSGPEKFFFVPKQRGRRANKCLKLLCLTPPPQFLTDILGGVVSSGTGSNPPPPGGVCFPRAFPTNTHRAGPGGAPPPDRRVRRADHSGLGGGFWICHFCSSIAGEGVGSSVMNLLPAPRPPGAAPPPPPCLPGALLDPAPPDCRAPLRCVSGVVPFPLCQTGSDHRGGGGTMRSTSPTPPSRGGPSATVGCQRQALKAPKGTFCPWLKGGGVIAQQNFIR